MTPLPDETPQIAFVGPGYALGGGRRNAHVLESAIDVKRIEKMLHEISDLAHDNNTPVHRGYGGISTAVEQCNP
jgi:hypothetical protein